MTRLLCLLILASSALLSVHAAIGGADQSKKLARDSPAENPAEPENYNWNNNNAAPNDDRSSSYWPPGVERNNNKRDSLFKGESLWKRQDAADAPPADAPPANAAAPSTAGAAATPVVETPTDFDNSTSVDPDDPHLTVEDTYTAVPPWRLRPGHHRPDSFEARGGHLYQHKGSNMGWKRPAYGRPRPAAHGRRLPWGGGGWSGSMESSSVEMRPSYYGAGRSFGGSGSGSDERPSYYGAGRSFGDSDSDERPMGRDVVFGEPPVTGMGGRSFGFGPDSDSDERPRGRDVVFRVPPVTGMGGRSFGFGPDSDSDERPRGRDVIFGEPPVTGMGGRRFGAWDSGSDERPMGRGFGGYPEDDYRDHYLY